IFAFYRFFSKNLEKRRSENANWLKFTGAIKKEFKLIQNKWKFRKTHIFKKCPNCKTVLRMKRVKGTHSVNCPHCGKKFSFKVL
ncbi:MAG: ZPR1-type zinc finger protein, partial [Clostridiales bacterium]|nr:ZPR1-type zinc finger protein [Clostridiales bacterium]